MWGYEGRLQIRWPMILNSWIGGPDEFPRSLSCAVTVTVLVLGSVDNWGLLTRVNGHLWIHIAWGDGQLLLRYWQYSASLAICSALEHYVGKTFIGQTGANFQATHSGTHRTCLEGPFSSFEFWTDLNWSHLWPSQKLAISTSMMSVLQLGRFTKPS